jgi:hypothetical protein
MPRGRSGWSTRVVRVLLLSVVGLLVVSLGTVVAARDEHPAPQPPTRGDMALANARADALALQHRAVRLASTLKQNAGPKAALSKTVRILERHRILLAPAKAHASAVPTPAANKTGLPDASPGPQENLSSLVKALARSGYAALDDAAGTTAGVAKMLAAAGTEQVGAAAALAAAASLPAPELPDTFVEEDFEELPGCAAAGPPAASPSTAKPPAASPSTASPPAAGPGPAAAPGPKQEANALQSTLTGLQRAVYVYESAAPRLSDKAASFAEARLRQHRRALEVGRQLLESICGHVPVAKAAYELPEGFRKAPGAALFAVEQDLLEMHTDLTGLSDGTVRQWTIGLLPRTSLAAQHWEQP